MRAYNKGERSDDELMKIQGRILSKQLEGAEMLLTVMKKVIKDLENAIRKFKVHTEYSNPRSIRQGATK